MRILTDSSSSASGQFQRVAAAFLAQPGLPFAEVLSVERVARIFCKHDNLFGRNPVYSTAVMVSVVVPGCRTRTLTIATTLTDAELYSKADIAELDGFRWNAELDPPEADSIKSAAAD